MAGLTRFAEAHKLSASAFTAIGAFSAATLGYFDWDEKDYERISVKEQVEVLALVGDIALQGASRSCMSSSRSRSRTFGASTIRSPASR